MNKGISLKESMPQGNWSYSPNDYVSSLVITSPVQYTRQFQSGIPVVYITKSYPCYIKISKKQKKNPYNCLKATVTFICQQLIRQKYIHVFIEKLS